MRAPARPWRVAVPIAVAAGALVLGWRAVPSDPAPDPHAAPVAAGSAAPDRPGTATVAVPMPPQVPVAAAASAPTASPGPAAGPQAADRPGALSAADIAELRASLAGHPQREAEVTRIVEYLDFQHRWTAFVDARARPGTDPATLRPLAADLAAALPHRLQRHEVTGAEAVMIQSRLLEVLVPDADARDAALRAWRDADRAALAAAPATGARP